jgi:hypothetical protein
MDMVLLLQMLKHTRKGETHTGEKWRKVEKTWRKNKVAQLTTPCQLSKYPL